MQYMKLYEMGVVFNSLNFEDIPRVIGVKFFTFFENSLKRMKILVYRGENYTFVILAS